MIVRQKYGDDPSVMAFAPKKDIFTRVRRRWRRYLITRELRRYEASRPTGLERFSDDRSVYGAELPRNLPPCDVVNLHQVDGFVDYQTFFSEWSQRTPLVWRLADMNVLTGGCHYDVGCGKFLEGCGQCPQLGSDAPEDLSKKVWARKKRAFDSLDSGRLHVVATSRWMADQIRKSPLLSRFSVTIIPNMIDTSTFAPRNRRFARDVLGLPHDARIVLFVSDGMTNKRKGLSFLAEALEGLSAEQGTILVSVGGGKLALNAKINYVHLGHVLNDLFLSVIYSAVDLFVMPSLQESFGQTVLEAMACGTPVVGFDVGGIPDMVRPGLTGRLVPVGDSVALGNAIQGLLDDSPGRERMAVECRRIALGEYSYKHLSDRYVELYHSMLHHHGMP
jgi:glycosyltransferase involved in cell wall biosynthesis